MVGLEVKEFFDKWVIDNGTREYVVNKATSTREQFDELLYFLETMRLKYKERGYDEGYDDGYYDGKRDSES